VGAFYCFPFFLNLQVIVATVGKHR